VRKTTTSPSSAPTISFLLGPGHLRLVIFSSRLQRGAARRRRGVMTSCCFRHRAHPRDRGPQGHRRDEEECSVQFTFEAITLLPWAASWVSFWYAPDPRHPLRRFLPCKSFDLLGRYRFVVSAPLVFSSVSIRPGKPPPWTPSKLCATSEAAGGQQPADRKASRSNRRGVIPAAGRWLPPAGPGSQLGYHEISGTTAPKTMPKSFNHTILDVSIRHHPCRALRRLRPRGRQRQPE